MLLPQTYLATMILTIVSMLCLGSWAVPYKIAGKWRFELYYLDFAFGLLIATVVLGFSVGSMGFDGFSLMDDLGHAGKRQWLFAFGAGVVFNLANMLILGAVSVAGMAVSFPIAAGLTIIVAILIGQVSGMPSKSGYLVAACLTVLVGVALNAIAYALTQERRREAAVKESRAKSARVPGPFKGLALATVGGLLMGSMYLLLAKATGGDAGLGPYSLMLLMALGAFFSTFFFDLFFMNLPVQGEPLELTEYFKGKIRFHVLGLFGGFIWCVGMLSNFLVGSAPPEANFNRLLLLPVLESGPIMAALWGLLVWKEFRGAGGRMATMAIIGIAMFGVGLELFSLALRSAK